MRSWPRGVDVFRINASHGTRDDRRGMVDRVRSRAAEAGRIVAVLQDLAGPKIRIGPLADPDGVELEEGARLRIAVGEFPGDAERVSTTCAPLAAAVRGGEPLLLDDGQIVLRAISADGGEIVAEVEHGGLLTPRKGINAPGVELPLSAVTDVDMEEIEAGRGDGGRLPRSQLRPERRRPAGRRARCRGRTVRTKSAWWRKSSGPRRWSVSTTSLPSPTR